jgi:hypothetical protein
MNDFHDLLEDASRPTQDWLADSHALLAEGRRRVRRRRVRAAALGCAVVLVAAGAAVGSGRWHLGPDTPTVVTPTSYADLDLSPLSTSVVQARCQAQLADNNNGEVTSFTVPDVVRSGTSRNLQPPRPWHVGLTVYGVPAADPRSSDTTACTIPESAAAPAPLTVTTDPAQLPRICSDNQRIDLSGWQVLAADADGDSQEALFRSGNGYMAECYSQNTRMGIQGDTGILEAGRWYGASVCSPVRRGDVECFGTGRVDDHTATRVAITLPSGRIVQRQATDGYWAVAVRDDASAPGSSDPLHAVALP